MKRKTTYVLKAYHPTLQTIWCKNVVHKKTANGVRRTMQFLKSRGYDEFVKTRYTYIKKVKC
jgi:hypothetical protein